VSPVVPGKTKVSISLIVCSVALTTMPLALLRSAGTLTQQKAEVRLDIAFAAKRNAEINKKNAAG